MVRDSGHTRHGEGAGDHYDHDDEPAETPWELAQRLVPLLVTGAWMGALFLGVDNWWVILVVGYAVVLPAVGQLGDYYDPRETSESEETDPVEELRQRYVDGEIDEDEFEQRLDELLSDGENAADRTASVAVDADRSRERERT
jgi:uncharacterized membrane protein